MAFEMSPPEPQEQPGLLTPPRRPRLSLQIKPATDKLFRGSVTALKINHDSSSPTAVNTFSNAYSTTVKPASPNQGPPTAIESRVPATWQHCQSKRATLRLETSMDGTVRMPPTQNHLTPAPARTIYPATPTSAMDEDTLPAVYFQPPPSAAAPTPPASAGPERPLQPFTIATGTTPIASPKSARYRAAWLSAPYSHPRSLRSILRNSPLPPRSGGMTPTTPTTPTRAALRLARRRNRHVGYNSPLEQTIVTNKYVKRHVDLIAEDSPSSATDPEVGKLGELDTLMAYTGDETRDGGHTPGPFEEMRRRLAGSELDTVTSKKRRRREQKRKWRWTIGGDGDDGGGGPSDETPTNFNSAKKQLTAIEKTPITSIWRGKSVETDTDTTASETDASDFSEAGTTVSL